MHEFLRQILVIPFLLLMFVVDLRDNPQRIFQRSNMTVVKPVGTWEKAADLPTPRYDYGSTVLNDMLYIVGGLVLPTPWLPTDRVDAYDPKEDRWNSIKS